MSALEGLRLANAGKTFIGRNLVMRTILTLISVLMMLVGCARFTDAPTTPALPGSNLPTSLTQGIEPEDGPHKLWGEWLLYIDAGQEKVDIVPRRTARIHMNALKFIEADCADCIEITGIKNNGDSSVDLTLRITHPFSTLPEYTGFDVKGIIMFNGSYEYPLEYPGIPLPQPTFRVSWKELGDPELLNPDGYTPRWSPSWESGSDLPNFNYWHGKFAYGMPNADLNAFLNFYTHEERHMFEVTGQVERTYTIFMPSPVIVAGYAVEACWEPPLVTPVTDPLNDFPITANQPEAYHFKFIINNGEVITDCDQCCGLDVPCTDWYIEQNQWYLHPVGHVNDRILLKNPPFYGDGNFWMTPEFCEEENIYLISNFWSCAYGNGSQRFVAINWLSIWPPQKLNFAYTFLDFTVNDPDI